MTTRPWHTGPPHMAFETRDCRKQSVQLYDAQSIGHASKPSGSPIKVTNIKTMIIFDSYPDAIVVQIELE